MNSRTRNLAIGLLVTVAPITAVITAGKLVELHQQKELKRFDRDGKELDEQIAKSHADHEAYMKQLDYRYGLMLKEIKDEYLSDEDKIALRLIHEREAKRRLGIKD